MYPMFVTAAVSKLVRGWLKAEAPWNMSRMSVTAAVSKLVRGWLKDEA